MGRRGKGALLSIRKSARGKERGRGLGGRDCLK